MKINKLILTAFISIPLFFSCALEEDENNNSTTFITSDYRNGFFVLNEGNEAKGTVTFVSNDLTRVEQDVYGKVNPGDALGGYVQSIFYNGDNAYIISGAANRITIVNRYTFKLISKIETGLAKPRYGVVKGGKAYVTNANTYRIVNNQGEISNPEGNTDDYISVIDLATNKIESKIELNATANRIVLENDKLYITEPYNNKDLLVVNPTTNALEASIPVGAGADTMASRNGILYVLTNTDLVKVNLANSTTTSLTFPETLSNPTTFTYPTNFKILDNTFYFTVANKVFSDQLDVTKISATSVLNYAVAPYGFDVKDNAIYITNAKDYATDGSISIYNLKGELKREINVGLNPNGFYFN
jgi:hypothetical protein